MDDKKIEEKSDDEISINFSDIKKIGKKAKKLFSNKKIFNKTTLIILLILISMFSALYFRAYTENLPQTEKWAENTIINHYKSQISTQVNAEYPNLPQVNKDTIINQKFQELYDSQKHEIEISKQSLAIQYKEGFQDETGQTYLLAIDPYTYMRKAQNLIETGTVCDEIKKISVGIIIWLLQKEENKN